MTGAFAAATAAAAVAAVPGRDGVAVFKWEEGTDVVLQRSGATVAQVGGLSWRVPGWAGSLARWQCAALNYCAEMPATVNPRQRGRQP